MISVIDDRDADESPELGPINFSLSGKGERGDWTAHAAMHRPDRLKSPRRIVLELELEKDDLNPLSTVEPDGGEKGGTESTGVMEPTLEQLEKSTRSLVKPLRALERWRGGKARGRKTEMDVVGLLTQINEQLASPDALEPFLQVRSLSASRTIGGADAARADDCRDLQGAHVLRSSHGLPGASRFEDERTLLTSRAVRRALQRTGRRRTSRLVSYEGPLPRAQLPGLRHPGSGTRAVPCQQGSTAVRPRFSHRPTLLPLARGSREPSQHDALPSSCDEPDPPQVRLFLAVPLAANAVRRYLGNMGVRASMSISITAFGELWGLVALHSYGSFGRRVSFPIRQLCKLLGDSISRNIERLSYAKRLHARKLINTVPTSANPSGYIVARAEDLLTLFGADAGLLSIGEEGKVS